MPIILKHINTSDPDNTKLDKVNYNFDQLVVNGGGPRGPQGSIGQDGTQGTTGQHGVQGLLGNIGYQGPQGAISINYWTRIQPGTIDADTIFPIHLSNNQYAPVVSIGYIENDPEYGTKATLIGGKTPYQWHIYRKTYLKSNLRFLNSSISDNFYDFKLEKLLGKNQMTMGFLYPQNSVSNYVSASTSFRGSISSSDNLLINISGTFFKKDTTFNSTAAIKNGLIIENANADTNRIAISDDATGLVKFKSVQELGGTVPFGTIVSILPSIFADNTKFVNTESILQGDSGAIHISAGKGVGNYEGWYLCHGKEWTNGIDTYLVPMLGNFNYSIDDDTWSSNINSQGSVTTSNNKTHITGGSNINMTAASVPTLIYNISSTISTSTIQVGPGTGTVFKIKQLPQIIYLGKNDLYWFDLGTGQIPSIPLTFLLDDANSTASKLNPDPYSLGISNHIPGSSYNFSVAVEAPAGYYWLGIPTTSDITGLPGYATITSITPEAGATPAIINISISISSHPSSVTTSTLNIDTTSFISANAATHYYLLASPTHSTILDNGTDGLMNDTKQTTQLIGSTYSFPVTITADSGYYFTQNEVDNLTLNSSTPSRIHLSNAILVNSTTITAALTDINFPSGGTTTIYWNGSGIILPTVSWVSNVSGSSLSELQPNTSGYGGAPTSVTESGVNIIKINGSSNRYLHLNLSASGPTGNGSATLSIIPTGPNPGTVLSGTTLSASTPVYGTVSSSGSYYLTPGTYQLSLSATISGVNSGNSYTSTNATAFYSTSLANTNPWEVVTY